MNPRESKRHREVSLVRFLAFAICGMAIVILFGELVADPPILFPASCGCTSPCSLYQS
jgi:hypothetical protein